MSKQPEIQEVMLPAGNPPGAVASTARINGCWHVAGSGATPAGILFVACAVNPEEASQECQTYYGSYSVKRTPSILKGPSGNILKDIVLSCGLSYEKDVFHTALIKWLVPAASRKKPTTQQLNYALPALEADIRLRNPKIIVCMGKPVFDILHGSKFKLRDIEGGWFWSEKYGCRLFVMDDMYNLATKPDYVEKFRTYIREVKRMYEQVIGLSVVAIQRNYRVIRTADELKQLVALWKDGNYLTISVDCEWAGRTHVDGKLRSVQFCWAPGQAAYVRFMDDALNYALDISYAEAGTILSEWLNRQDVSYVGHHFAADAPWLHTVLGLEVFGKCAFDTEFGQQVVDEFEDLKLERLAIKYTDLG
jgi:uracil-DNA glycosylase family 4